MPQSYLGKFILGSQDPSAANICSIQMSPSLHSLGLGLVSKMFSFTISLSLIFKTGFPLKHLAVLSLCRYSTLLHRVPLPFIPRWLSCCVQLQPQPAHLLRIGVFFFPPANAGRITSQANTWVPSHLLQLHFLLYTTPTNSKCEKRLALQSRTSQIASTCESDGYLLKIQILYLMKWASASQF